MHGMHARGAFRHYGTVASIAIPSPTQSGPRQPPLRYNREEMNFEIIDETREVEIIATGKSIRNGARLKKV